MRKYRHLTTAIIILLLIANAVAYGQNGRPLPEPSFHWRYSGGDTLLNHNPALRAGDGVLAFDSLPYAGEYTLIAVYRPARDSETFLWRMTFGDSASRGLTSERIMSDSLSIRYAGYTTASPAISTLRQSSPDSTAPFVRLTVGGAGGLTVSEILYYPMRLGNAALRKVQSFLAVRYGVTLGPVAYLDGTGRHVWDYADSGMYHHRVTGVGVDTLTGLCQLRSRSEMEGAVLTVSTDSLGAGSWLMLGDDDASLAFRQKGDAEILERSWKTQSIRTVGRTFTLKFDTRGWSQPGDSLVLLVDDTLYLPVRQGSDSVVFEGVVFPTDSSLFTLGRGSLFRQLAQPGGKGLAPGRYAENGDGASSGRFTAQVYPNPSRGWYTVEVEGAEQVRVTVYSTLGQEVATFSDDGHERYRFEGELPLDNVYYATVVTEKGSQTIKLVTRQ